MWTRDVILCLGAIQKPVMSWALDPGAKASREDRRAAGTGTVGPRQAGRRQATGFNLAFDVPCASE